MQPHRTLEPQLPFCPTQVQHQQQPRAQAELCVHVGSHRIDNPVWPSSFFLLQDINIYINNKCYLHEHRYGIILDGCPRTHLLLLTAFPKQSVTCHAENLYNELRNNKSHGFPIFSFDYVNITCGFTVKKKKKLVYFSRIFLFKKFQEHQKNRRDYKIVSIFICEKKKIALLITMSSCCLLN